MRWEELKNATNPRQWVIIEAIAAHTEADNRIVDDLRLVELFSEDNNEA